MLFDNKNFNEKTEKPVISSRTHLLLVDGTPKFKTICAIHIGATICATSYSRNSSFPYMTTARKFLPAGYEEKGSTTL